MGHAKGWNTVRLLIKALWLRLEFIPLVNKKNINLPWGLWCSHAPLVYSIIVTLRSSSREGPSIWRGSYFRDLWRTFPITLGNQYIRGILAGTACASPLALPIVPHRDAIRGVNMFTLFCPSISFTKPKHYKKTPTQTQQTQSASAGAATLWKNSNLSQSWPQGFA